MRAPRFRLPAGVAPTAKAIQASTHQRTRQRNGEDAEAMVEKTLKARGFLLVEKVEVPFRIDNRTGQQYAKRKVSGDFRAISNTGISVLVEVKRHDERLSYSAFRPHQVEALDTHWEVSGITEVAWVDRGTLYSIPWERFRAIGFGPGKSVTWNGADIEITKPARRAAAKKAST